MQPSKRDLPNAESTAKELVIPVLREELSVGKRTVDTGRGVHIDKTVSEYPFRIDELLLHDEIEVTHLPVDRLVDPDAVPVSRYEGDAFVIPVLEEVLVLEKRMRIKEEIRITKKVREERRAETVMLKSEDVVVKRFGDSSEA